MIECGPALHRLRRAVERCVADIDGALLVACSGGPDSLALSAAVAVSRRPATVVIVDHGLQRGSSDVAARAAGQCRALGLDRVTVITTEVVARGEGPEAAAREARYRVLAQQAESIGASAVLLGHTRDDQAETVLLGLARGSGLRSLSGMPPIRGVFRRPFLAEPRSVIRDAVTELGVEPWDDPHNSDPAYLRSRVRGDVLPMLEAQLGPGVGEALARTADQARADADALDGWAGRAGAELARQHWPVDGLMQLPQAVRLRVLRDALRAAGSPSTDLTARHLADVDRLLTDWRGQGPLHLPGRINVTRRYGRLSIGGDDILIGARDGA